jgi:hypothetical protein
VVAVGVAVVTAGFVVHRTGRTAAVVVRPGNAMAYVYVRANPAPFLGIERHGIGIHAPEDLTNFIRGSTDKNVDLYGWQYLIVALALHFALWLRCDSRAPPSNTIEETNGKITSPALNPLRR